MDRTEGCLRDGQNISEDKDIMNEYNSEVNSVLNVLKTTKMSETKVKSIEKSLNAMKHIFDYQCKRLSETDITSDEMRDNQKNKDKKVKTNQEIEYKDEKEVIVRKDSFDRFSDDLSELIVSYLTIEDKIV